MNKKSKVQIILLKDINNETTIKDDELNVISTLKKRLLEDLKIEIESIITIQHNNLEIIQENIEKFKKINENFILLVNIEKKNDNLITEFISNNYNSSNDIYLLTKTEFDSNLFHLINDYLQNNNEYCFSFYQNEIEDFLSEFNRLFKVI
jgi:hypothetical protein